MFQNCACFLYWERLLWVQFDSTEQTSEVIARSPVDFDTAIGFLDKWTQGMDLASMDAGLVVTTKFPRLLPEFTPYLQEIGSNLGFVVGDNIMEDENITISKRLGDVTLFCEESPAVYLLAMYSCGRHLAKECTRKEQCLVYGQKGHLAAECTRKVPSHGQATEQVRESQPQPSVDGG